MTYSSAGKEPGYDRWAFIVLLPDPDDRRQLAELLTRVRLSEAGESVEVLAAPRGGKDYFAEVATEVAAWEKERVPAQAQVIYLLMHERGLEEIAAGHQDRKFYVGVGSPRQEGLYTGLANVTPFIAGSPLAFFNRLLEDWGEVGQGRQLFTVTQVEAGSGSGDPDEVRSPAAAGELEAEDTDDLVRRLREPFKTTSLPATSLLSDIWTVNDTLGYRPLAEAVASFIGHGETRPPITIGIRAPWGAGKTSLMRMIREALDPADPATGKRSAIEVTEPTRVRRRPTVRTVLRMAGQRDRPRGFRAKFLRMAGQGDRSGMFRARVRDGERVTVWFNPWMYQTGEQVWAGLAQEMITQVTERMPVSQREAFWLQLTLQRVDREAIRRVLYRVLLRQMALPGEILATGVVTAAALMLAAAPRQASGAALGIGGLLAAATAMARWWRLRREPARNVVGSLVQWRDPMQVIVQDSTPAALLTIAEPAYSARAGFLQFVHSDVRAVLDLVATQAQPLVVFIDDLDRCSPGVVKQVIEAMNAFLAGEFPNCVFVLAIEPRAAVASIEAAYPRLVKAVEPLNEDGPSLGWRFLDKLVQLPLQLPTAPRQVLPDYLEGLGQPVSSGAEVATPTAPEEPAAGSERQNPGKGSRNEQTNGAASWRRLYARLAEASTLDEISSTAYQLRKDRAAPDDEIVQAATKVFNERFNTANLEVDTAMNEELDGLAVNGREIKRFVNLFRFYAVIGARRRLQGYESATIREAATLAAMTARWPDIIGAIAEQAVLDRLRAAAGSLDRERARGGTATTGRVSAWAEGELPALAKDFPAARLAALAKFLQVEEHDLSTGARSLLVG